MTNIKNKISDMLLSMVRFIVNTISVEGIITIVFIYQMFFTCAFLLFGVLAITELITMKDTSSNILSVVIAGIYLLLGPVYVFFSVLFYKCLGGILNKINDQ